MAAKGGKDSIATRLGFRSGGSAPSKADLEMERVRKENAHLRRKVDELAGRHAKPPDPDKSKLLEVRRDKSKLLEVRRDKSKLLERILSLETLRERNNQLVKVREQEMEALRQQLTARGGEVVAALQAQMEQLRREAEQRERSVHSLTEEAENLKNRLAAATTRCQSLEAGRGTQSTQGGSAPSGAMAVLETQLKDALEKNQQWLLYDQQREAYVRSVVSRTVELEQQLSQTPQNLQGPQTLSQAPQTLQGPQTSSEENNDAGQTPALAALQKDLAAQREAALRAQQELQQQRQQASSVHEELCSQKEQVSRLQEELSSLQRDNGDRSSELAALQRRYKERSRELEHAMELLQEERLSSRHLRSEERLVSSEQAGRMREELEEERKRMREELEEERKRSAELLLQVNLLQKSLLSQTEEQRRISTLEQQILLTAKDFENEKVDRQTTQHQLHKVLKELRKARDQITRLESAKPATTRFSEPSSYHALEFERLAIRDPEPPGRACDLLDESFLECPNCRASYPTSQHRELLAHIDYCLA